MAYEAFSALIVEASPTKRSYLWQATLSEPQFGRVKGIKSLEEAICHLEDGNKFDVLLLSNSHSRLQLKNFILKGKESSGGKEAAYVLVLPEDDEIRETIALTMKDGMDGFLFSPFSVNSLKEVAKIAAAVKHKFESERAVASLKLLLPDVTQALDALAFQKIKSKDCSEKEKEFKRVSANLREVALGFRELYVDQLTEICERAKPRQLPSYKGASERVKALIGSKKVP